MSIFGKDPDQPEQTDVDDSAAQFEGMEKDPTESFSPTPAAFDPEPDIQTSEVHQSVGPTEGANVILSSDRLDEALPEGRTNIGRVGIDMPTPEEQAAGFKLDPEKASVLVAQFRQYKFLVKKGQATPPVKIGE